MPHGGMQGAGGRAAPVTQALTSRLESWPVLCLQLPLGL